MTDTITSGPEDATQPLRPPEPRATHDPLWTAVPLRPPFRPAPPSHGLSRALRRVAGIDEDILDEVPEERARYTRMGAIIVATGLMAMLSASVFLSRVGAPFVFLLPIAVFWGLLILCFDSWLVASTHGLMGVAKLGVFIPRLLISILMGAVIAEPLLLFLFGPAIETEVRDRRLASIGQYETHLRDCNPLTGAAPIVSGCGEEFVLNVPGSPVTSQKEKDDTEAQRTEVQNRITAVNQELTRREDLARIECNGTKADGTTGVSGVGPNCRRNRSEADRYRDSTKLDEDQAALVQLDAKVDELNRRLGEVGGAYSAVVTQRIADKVAAKQSNQGDIGILDEHAALQALTERSAFVFSLTWMVRLLLVLVDCLPVLTKLMSRTTTYDSMLRRQLDMSDRIHELRTTEREQRDKGRLNVVIQRSEQQVREEMERIDEATRATRADRETSLDDQIEALAAKLRAERRGS